MKNYRLAYHNSGLPILGNTKKTKMKMRKIIKTRQNMETTLITVIGKVLEKRVKKSLFREFSKAADL